MKYRVAPSFNGYKLIGTPFTKSGKLYSAATCKCERCSGSGIYTLGAMFNGTCFACNGTGKITKEIRLYTESEYTRLIKATEQRHEKAATKKQQEQKRIGSRRPPSSLHLPKNITSMMT